MNGDRVRCHAATQLAAAAAHPDDDDDDDDGLKWSADESAAVAVAAQLA